MSDLAAPRVAAKMAKSLHSATGVQPVVTQIDGALWQLVLENDRVRLTMDYRGHLGKAKWAGSTLAIDGKQRPIARDFDDFLRIWRKYSHKQALGELAPIPSRKAGMPSEVRVFFEQIRSKIEATGTDPAVLEAGYSDSKWIVGLDLAPASGIRFILTRKGTWGLSAIQVVRDGKDISRAAAGDIAKALELLAPAPADTPGTGPIAGAAPAAASNAVQTRRHSVIRN